MSFIIASDLLGIVLFIVVKDQDPCNYELVYYEKKGLILDVHIFIVFCEYLLHIYLIKLKC